ncbi:molybdopterin cofactor sulfurase, putative [Pediculus humanus corporis]|uniref:Molybdopterin cofactor sulfurase, putative n=1 Tax=Pediculus humanus subsp. corporis TaxID=121224 RepID=E0VCG4_PEDHC|nr:molybdopterin cofactor sulfurase, putative [Pediculus humanus corporis]EEB11070.1 molybdopterin cofactor sulfurase, putative [Pediculus humanus corporis]
MWKYNNYLKNKPPKNWIKIGEISELCIYPIKSCKAFKSDYFECTPFGLKSGTLRDRSFVILNDKGNVISGRIYPKMSQIFTVSNGSTFKLSSPDMSDGEIEFTLDDIEKGKTKTFEIWTVPIEGRDCGDKIGKWLSKCILNEEKGLRLFYCASLNKGKRMNPKITKITNLTKVPLNENDGGFFSDSVSYHLISNVSTEYLNTRSNGEIITPLNFRPNFVVKGERLIPFEEDNWEWVKIGNAVFKNLSPCTRCIFTTVDPATGQRSKNMEPLTSMKRFRNLRDPRKRQIMPSPSMGIYLGLRTYQSDIKVSVGDSVYVPES